MKIRHRIRHIVCALAISASTVGNADGNDRVDPRISINPVISTYEVSGSSWKEILGSIESNRPTLAGSTQRWQGVTKVTMDLDGAANSDGICEPKDRQVLVVVEIHVPHLSDPSRLSYFDQQKWAAFDRALFDHEEVHLVIAIDKVEAFLKSIDTQGEQPCANIRALHQKAYADLALEQAKYDDLTQHGLRQSDYYNQQ